MGEPQTRIASCIIAGKPAWGLVRDDGFVDLGRRNPQYPTVRDALEAGALKQAADAASGASPDHPLSALRYQIPVPNAQKIICIGINYPARNEEYSEGNAAAKYPGIFFRATNSFVGHNEKILRPPESDQLDYEGEVTIIIGKTGRRIREEDAYDHIAAVTAGNEGTIRDWLRHSRFNVTQGKNFDATGSIGPWMVPYTQASQLDDIRLETKVNGALRQEDRTARMIYKFRFIIAYVSAFTTLYPGDIILTGTPVGTGVSFNPPIWLKPGDVLEVGVEGVGMLRNEIADETGVTNAWKA
jgi:2-keto-4-pentenoate hydratase/2-oxohepta-3-ene-1,7-dioic acid hydratase in catechol pathway